MLSYFHGFTKITSSPIILHKNIPDENIRLVYGDRKLIVIDADDIPEASRNNIYLNIYNIPKTEYADPRIHFNYYYGNHYIYPYLTELSIDDMLNEPIKFISRMNYFITRKENSRTRRREVLFIKLDKNCNIENEISYNISYYIKDDIIEICKQECEFLSPITTKSSNLLIELLISQKHTDIIKQNDNNLSNIIDFDEKQIFNLNEYNDLFESHLLKPDINLYNYQKQDVTWMKTIENNVDNGSNTIEYSYSKEYKVLDNFYLHDNLLLPEMSNCEKITRQFQYYGGNIISEVGLGKTLITLYYILQNDRGLKMTNDNFVTFGETCNYFYKRGKNKGKCCEKRVYEKLPRESLYCKEHHKTPFIDKRQLVLKNLNQFDFKKFIINNQEPRIKTNASLIICKNQLCDQWVQEYYNKFKNDHRILLVATYDQYANLTLADLLFADIVVVSYEFLTNKRYQQQNLEKSSVALLSIYLDSYNTSDNHKLLNTKLFNCFNMFYWRRIIYDEAHEIPKTMRTNDIQSKYKWNITGTPFVDKSSSFLKLMSYNTNYIDHNISTINLKLLPTNYLIEMGLAEDTFIDECKNLFRRNTKTSIVSEYDKNIINEFTNLLDFTDQERSIYDGYVTGAKTNYINFLIRLCCHPELNDDTREMIKNCKTFDEIHSCLLNYNKTQINMEEKRIKNIEQDIEYYENELSERIESELIESEQLESERVDLRLKINLLKRKLTISKKNYESISRTYNYLKSRLENLKTSEMCPICLEEIDPVNLTITKCGHKFCWDCLYQTHKAQDSLNIKCPSCNTIMSSRDIFLLKEQSENEIQSDNELSKIIQTVKSTKIGNIIHFLKTTLQSDDKVILFSQWDELLHKVGDILSNQNINLMYCNGSVYKRKRAINSFYKDPSINLIMLSSKNSASGINLTVANKIIFLEPIYGKEEYRKNIEYQAIGRADRLGQTRPIDIYRFIIKDTIEQDIYNNCIDDSKIRNIS